MFVANIRFALAVLAAGQVVFSEDNSSNVTTLVQPVFTPLSLGSTKPLGWFKDQLQLEADGLSGNMFDFYRFVHDSRYIGGATEYSGLDEASPYWFNGLVPLAFSLGDERLIGQVRYYLDYVLDHQQTDGWLGFETTRATRGLWGRCLLLLGLMQYADADPTQTDRIVSALHRYVELAHSMLANNYTGLLVHGNDTFDTAGFGVGRTHEYHIPFQWLLEKYPRNNSQILWESMELMIEGGAIWGADWRTFWTEESYPKVYTDDTYNMSWVFAHGVNHAEGIRYPLSIYRMTHDETLKKQTRTALDLLSQHHRSSAGSIVADEYIGDLNPSRGSELCISAEVMFSTAYIHQFLGDNDIADWVEQAAFNAFPASVAPDWWSHQYVQQENQPWARNLSTDDAWYDVNSYANVFGLEPNYPCCTVNHPQAYPKFLANSFATTEDGGLAHLFLIPASVATTLGKSGNSTTFVTANTTYPFGNTISYSISASSPFDFYIRIPTWADSNSTVDSKATVRDGHGLHKLTIPAGESTTTVTFSTSPRIVERANGTVAIYYGALLYALAIEHDSTSHPPVAYRTQQVLGSNTTDPEGRTKDYFLTPKSTSKWNVAIDPSQIKFVQRADPNADVRSPIWDLGAPPVELRVAAVEIDWPVVKDTAANPGTFDIKRTGKSFWARFVPYGSAKLHMAVLPKVELDTPDEEQS